MRLLAILALALCVGCTGPEHEPPPAPTPEPDLIADALDLIREAGLTAYADEGSMLYASGRLRMARVGEMPAANYNGWCDFARREVLISEAMPERYPNPLDQATIVLHELIHWRSGEQTHLGPWWAAQDRFRQYWSDN